MLFIEAPRTMDELKTIGHEFRNAKLVANMIEGGKTPEVDAWTLAELGFKLVFWPCSAPYVVLKNLIHVFEVLKRDGTTAQVRGVMYSFSEFNKLVNLEKFTSSTDEID